MIVQVKTKKQLKQFIYFISTLYKGDKTYAYPIFSALKKELFREVIASNNYTALLSVKDGITQGRIMYTVDKSKKEHKEVGYFSFFDCVDDGETARELFAYMENDLKKRGVDYVEGTFCPYDPDTRRGILVSGFTERHSIFTSKNYPYYKELIEDNGYVKAYDTYTVTTPLTDKNFTFAKRIADFAKKKNDVVISDLNFKRIDDDIAAVCAVLKEATNEINYQEAPDEATVRSVFNNMKFFLNKKLIKIARERKTGKAVGFCLTLPDFNELLILSKGKITPRLIFNKGKIKGARGMLQYVIPEYQKSGVIGELIYETYKSVKELKMNYFEGGTILEENEASWGVYVKFGGRISKIYRIYKKEL